jgi:hypothetical protein
VRKGNDLTTFIVPKVETIQEPLPPGTSRTTSGLYRKTFTFTFRLGYTSHTHTHTHTHKDEHKLETRESLLGVFAFMLNVC